MRYLGSGLMATVALLVAENANAIVVFDLDPSDENRITRQEELLVIPEIPPAYLVEEDYGERRRIEYPSHDGYGIVNRRGKYFDKRVFLEDSNGWWTLVIRATNTSPFVWSDYRFEFWTADYRSRLEDFPLGISDTLVPEGPYDNAVFLNSAWDGSELALWAPEHQVPGQVNTFTLTVDLTQVRSRYGDQFGIRQVATTIPEAGSLPLLGLGLVGLGVVRRRKAT